MKRIIMGMLCILLIFNSSIFSCAAAEPGVKGINQQIPGPLSNVVEPERNEKTWDIEALAEAAAKVKPQDTGSHKSLAPAAVSQPVSITLDGTITDITCNAAGNMAYAVDSTSKILYSVNLTDNKTEKVTDLVYTPSGICILENGSKLLIVNNDNKYLLTVVDLNSKQIEKNVEYSIPVNADSSSHRHVYQKNGRVYVVGGEFAPALYVFDAATFDIISSKAVEEIGGISFPKSGDSFYCWRQLGWNAGNSNSAVNCYSITGSSITLTGSTTTNSAIQLGRDPLDTPIILLDDNNELIYKNYMLKMNDLGTSIRQFPEPVYAVNPSCTMAVGKQNIYDLQDNSLRPVISSGTIVSLFFAGEKLLSLSRTDDGKYFIEEIWTGESFSIGGKIDLGFGVTAPTGGIKVSVKATDGVYASEGTVTIPYGQGSVSYLFEGLPAQSGYIVSYSILNGTDGKAANDYGYLPAGYFNINASVVEQNSATPIDLSAGDYTANISLLGNRTISGIVRLPEGETTTSGGLFLVMAANNGQGDSLVPAVIKGGAVQAAYTIHVPSTAAVSRYDVICYNLYDDRYFYICGYSISGTVTNGSTSTWIDIKDGNRNGIDITLVKARTISGMVSLPAGEAAPSGGMNVGITAKNGDFSTTVKVAVPEGKNSCSYSIAVPAGVKQAVKVRLGAFTDQGTSGYYDDDVFNSSDMVCIASGSESSKYEISYSLQNIGGYLSGGYYTAGGNAVASPALVDVAAGSRDNINVSIFKGERIISGKISLPAGAAAPGGGVFVRLEAGNSVLNRTLYSLVTIPEGANSADYSISVPAASGYTVSYEYLYSANTGYISYGYYSTGGTVLDFTACTKVDTTGSDKSDINLGIVRGIPVSGTIRISQPASYDLDGLVYLWNENGEYSCDVKIPKGGISAAYTVYVPANGSYSVQYYLSNHDGYIKQGYYKDSYSTTSMSEDAKPIDVKSTAVSNVNLSIIPAPGSITGTVYLPGGTYGNIYRISVPYTNAGYLVYYYLPTSTDLYLDTGYYSLTGTVPDAKSLSLVKLNSGSANYINLSVLSKTAAKNSTIYPTSAAFDKYVQADIQVAMTLNGNTLSSVTNVSNGTAALRNGIDYIVTGDKVIIRKSYLANLSGTVILKFKFSAGADAQISINIFNSAYTPVDTTPSNPSYPPASTVTPSPSATPTPTPTLVPSVTPKADGQDGADSKGVGQITVIPDIKGSSGKVDISPDDFMTLLGKATVKNGVKNVEINVDCVGLTGYEASFRASAFTDAANKANISIKTELAELTLPNNMFSGSTISNAQSIEINVSAVDVSTLPASVAKKIGDAPIVNISVTVDGKIKAWNNPKAPVTVSIPHTLKPGESRDNITVYYIDGAGRLINMQGFYDEETGMVTFTTTHFSKYLIMKNEPVFNDLRGFEKYGKYIRSMAAKGIMSGVGSDKFAPGKELTRAEFAVLLANMLKLDTTSSGNAFKDVKAKDWYASYVNAAYKAGLISGTGNGKFSPGAVITTQDAAIILVKVLKYKGITIGAGTQARIEDSKSIDSYAMGSVKFVVGKNIITLDSRGNFNAKGTVTRALAAKYIYNVYNYKN